MFNFLFYQEDVPSKGYRVGDMKPGWAISLLIICFLATGFLEGMEQLPR